MKWLVSLTVVLAAVIAGVSLGGGGCSEVSGGDLRVAIGEPLSIDPNLVAETEGRLVAAALFECLTGFDPVSSELRPGVAESWDSSSDAKVWTFHLRSDSTFHNGRHVVAADFKYSWERLSDPHTQSPFSGLLSMVKGFEEFQSGDATSLEGVRVVDDLTLEVTLAAPFTDFPMVLGVIDTAPVPREEVERDPAAFGMKPVGNGRFMMVEPWQPGVGISLTRFDGYKGAKPKLDGVDFKIYADEKTAYLDFRAGQLDWCRIPPGQYQASVERYGLSLDGYTSNPGSQVQNGAELSTYYLALNNSDPLLSNVHLRRALSLAINRATICEVLWEGVARPASSCLPEGLPGWREGQWDYCEYDVEAAKAELVQAGYPGGDGLPAIRLTYNAGALQDEFVQLVQADLDEIGVVLELDGGDGATFQSKLLSGDFQIGQWGWGCDYPSAYGYLSPLFTRGLETNFDRYSPSDAVQEELDALRQMVKREVWLEAAERVTGQIGEDCPDIPIATAAHSHVASSRVHALTFSPLYLLDFASCWVSE